MQSGYIAAGTFLLLTGTGSCAQLLKLWRREHAWKRGEIQRTQIYDGLHPVRECWSLIAFILFALSGLTRSYTDYFLLLSRLPVIVLSTTILGLLAAHGAPRARRLLLVVGAGNIILIAVLCCTGFGVAIHGSLLSRIVDLCLSAVSVLLFYGKIVQAQTMYLERRSAGVSWLRELGLVVKDLSGLWYALGIGSELMLVGLTHSLSAVSSGSICLVKYLLERGPRPRLKHQDVGPVERRSAL